MASDPVLTAAGNVIKEFGKLATSEIEKLSNRVRQLETENKDLLDFLAHMHYCQTCGDGPWQDCEVGRKAEEALVKAGLYNP